MKILGVLAASCLCKQVFCMTVDPALDYIKELAVSSRKCENLKEEKKYAFAYAKPEVIFNKFYDFFDVVGKKFWACRIYALFAALEQITLTEGVDGYVVNRVCEQAEYLRKLDGDKYEKVKDVLAIADDIKSYIPYAGMTLCVYTGVRPLLTAEVRKKTHKSVLKEMAKLEYENPAFDAFSKFVRFIGDRAN